MIEYIKRGKYWLLLLVAAGMTVNVARSIAAGQDTGPREKDKVKAARVLAPKGGIDERAEIPEGNYVAGNGIVEPVGREIKVAAEVAGRVARVFVQEGDHVEAGAVLLSLCNSVEKAALEVAEAQLRAARVELLRTVRGMRKEDVDAVVADTAAGRVRVENSQDSVERVRKLARTGAATPDELDRSEKQAELDRRLLDVAEARRKAALAGGRTEDNWIAQARFTEAEARREQANEVLERLTVRAPIASEILQVKYRVGEYYSPGGMDPLIILGNTSSLRVRMDVDERDIAKVTVGSKSFVISNAFLGRRFAGKVVEIGKRMGRKNVRTDDPTERIDTKILEVVIELNDKSVLVPGQRVVSYVEASKL